MDTAEREDYNLFEIHYLNPQRLRLFRTDAKDTRIRLTLEEDCSWLDVSFSRAFPFSDPDHYIALNDAVGKEIGQLRTLDGVDSESRRLIEQELSRRYFTPVVQSVESVTEEYGMVTWSVGTDRGAVRFVVRNIRDNTFSLGSGRLLMIDVEGNRYEFSDVNSYGPDAYQVLAKVM